MTKQRISAPISRRTLLGTTAAAGAALTASRVLSASAAPGIKQQFSATYQDGGEITFALTSDDQAKIQPLLDEYQADTGTTVNTATAPYGDLYTQLNITLTQAGDAYDVVSLDDPWIPQFAGGEFLLNLEELMDAQGITIDADFIPELLALGDFPAGTGLRGIPWVGNVQVFAWRTDLLEELGATAPATWDDVLALATQVTEAMGTDGVYGIGVRGQPGNPAATSFLPTLRGFGKDLLDPETSEPQLETSEAMEAIALHLSLAGQAPPGIENVGHAENGINLYSGAIAMSGDIWPDQLLQAFDPELSQVVGMIEVGAEPAQPGVEPANMTGNWLLGIPSGSQNAERALDFITWFTSAEIQKRLILENNIPATRTSVMQDEEAVAKLPFLPGMLAAAGNALPRPRTPFYGALEEIYGRYVSQAIAGQTDGESAMRDANQEMRELLVREGVLS
ncbi:ABC transporter substrate-binding protein [soil metagenome]